MLKKFMNNRFLVVLSIILIILATFFGAKAYIERPQNLGPQLEYVGKSDYGCYIFCDARPSSVYYFATDRTREELRGYFSKATYIENPYNTGGSSAHYNFVDLIYETNADEKFYLVLYDNTQAVVETHQLKKTDKQFIISIGDSHFLRAQASL